MEDQVNETYKWNTFLSVLDEKFLICNSGKLMFFLVSFDYIENSFF